MLALKKEVGFSPKVIYIPQSGLLKALQETVKGYIETVTFNSSIGRYVVICNEEGRLMGMPHNCYIEGVEFVGDILIVGYGAEDFTDVPDKVIKYYLRKI